MATVATENVGDSQRDTSRNKIRYNILTTYVLNQKCQGIVLLIRLEITHANDKLLILQGLHVFFLLDNVHCYLEKM